MNPIVEKLRASLALKLAAEVKPLEVDDGAGEPIFQEEVAPAGYVYVDEFSAGVGARLSGVLETARMNKKMSGIKLMDSGRAVFRVEWADWVKEQRGSER